MTLGFAEVAWTKSPVKNRKSSKSQTGGHCISSEFYNFETGDPYKEKRNRSTTIGSLLENEDPTNLKHALKKSTTLKKNKYL